MSSRIDEIRKRYNKDDWRDYPRLVSDIDYLLSQLKDGGPEDGIAIIAAERRRHFEQEGWTPNHDDEHVNGEMAQAAACYAWPSPRPVDVKKAWPWRHDEWKPELFGVGADEAEKRAARIRTLAKAGALIAAEIDRLRRATAPSETSARCVMCHHVKLNPWHGYCQHEVTPFGARPVKYCGHKCVFPASTEQAGERVPEWSTEHPDYERKYWATLGKNAAVAQPEVDPVDERLVKALRFCRDLAEEELQYAQVGTGAEVALRHIARKARETLGGE